MRFPRGLSVLAAGVLATVLLSPPPTARAAEPEHVLRIGSTAPSGTPWSAMLVRVKKRIHKATDGRIKVKLYLSSKLGSENSMVRRCQKGSLDGIGVSVGAVGAAVPELFATELPYLYDYGDYAKIDKSLEAARSLVTDLMAKRGLIFYMWGENGFRHFAHKEKFIDEPTDVAGVKMRTQPAMPHVEMYKELGASAFPISVGEVVGALAANNVTGYDNTFLYAFATQWYEQVKYITLSGHIYQGAIVAWCKASYDRLPPDVQQLMLQLPPDEEKKGRIAVRAMNKLLKKKYAEKGKELKELSASEAAAFKQATKPVTAKFLATTTPEGKQLYEILSKTR